MLNDPIGTFKFSGFRFTRRLSLPRAKPNNKQDSMVCAKAVICALINYLPFVANENRYDLFTDAVVVCAPRNLVVYKQENKGFHILVLKSWQFA